MHYKDLKEMTIKEWDGRPFRAIYVQLDEEELYDTDVERLNGIKESCLILGYINGRWCDENGLYWNHVYPMEWNKKPKKRMTNRQLAMWLAKGNGEMLYASRPDMSIPKYSCVYNRFVYELFNESLGCDDNIRVRKWDSEEWIEPTVDLLED